jgi:hypothetical protein
MRDEKTLERIQRLTFLLYRLETERALPGHRGGSLAEEIRAKHELLWRQELTLLQREHAA